MIGDDERGGERAKTVHAAAQPGQRRIGCARPCSFPEIRRLSRFTQPAQSARPKLRARSNLLIKQPRQTFCEYFAQFLPSSALQQPESICRRSCRRRRSLEGSPLHRIFWLSYYQAAESDS